MKPANTNGGASHDDSLSQSSEGTKVKELYSKPTLTRYGRVAALSKGGVPSALSDSGMNSMRPP